jgi:hypothetical protein
VFVDAVAIFLWHGQQRKRQKPDDCTRSCGFARQRVVKLRSANFSMSTA